MEGNPQPFSRSTSTRRPRDGGRPASWPHQSRSALEHLAAAALSDPEGLAAKAIAAAGLDPPNRCTPR